MLGPALTPELRLDGGRHDRRRSDPGRHGRRRDGRARPGAPTSPSPTASSPRSATASTGKRVLDAGGHVVTPGFVDIHTHYDAQVFWDPSLTPSCWHGVTSVVAGNCGFSIAPVRPEHRELLVRTLQHVEDMAPDTLFEGVPWDDFETFPQYLDAIEQRGTLLNYACYVGHTAVRIFVMGEAGYEQRGDRRRDPRHAARHRRSDGRGRGRLRDVRRHRRTAATGAVRCRRASPTSPSSARCSSRCATRTRASSRCCPARRSRTPTCSTLQRAAGRPVTWTALLTVKGYPWHEKIMAANTAARAEGVEVWPQVSCRPLTFQMNLREPFTFNMRSTFQELMDRPDRRAHRRVPRSRVAHARVGGARRPRGKRALPINFDALARRRESPTHPELIGRKVIDDRGRARRTPLDVMLDLSLEENLETRFTSVLANNDPDAIAWLLPQDTVLLGLADSGAHVTQLCDACFATDLLGNWVRDKEVMPLEHAIHKLTGEPAGVFGLHDRGTLEVGKAADVVVFDFDTVAPGPLRRIRDFPADGERLVADRPVGMRHVVVNGTVIREDEQPVDGALEQRPGKLLRS